MNDKIQIAVSACLLGHKVRYDAKEKKQIIIIDVFINKYADAIELVPFCPEVAIGLSVPRDKIQLVTDKNGQKGKQIRLLGVADHTLDVTHELQSYTEKFLLQYPDIKYYIVKSKSPSCGYGSTPLFFAPFGFAEDSAASRKVKKPEDYEQTGFTSGLFVQTLQVLKPELVIIEETQLDTEQACEMLVQRIQNTA